jgi:hypothetical protein
METRTMSRKYHSFDPETFFAGRENLTDDVLIDLQCQVLNALESTGHPEFAKADRDPALKDNATDSERKAWLAIYGPLTDVAI